MLAHGWVALLSYYGLAAAKEMCSVVPSHGLTSLSSECLPSDAPIPYGVSIYEGGLQYSTRAVGCHLGLEITGDLGQSSQIAISTPTAVVKKRVQFMASPMGHLTEGKIKVLDRACDVPWACSVVEVSDGHRWWSLDCEGTIRKKGDEMILRLGGSKPYRITVVTEGQEGEKSKATIGIRLKGTDGSSTRSLTLMSGDRTPGMLFQTILKAADVGTIASINITNYATKEPWKFKSLLIYTDDGNVARFDGGQWIGSPFTRSMEFVNLQEAGQGTLDVVATPVECHTRLDDILSGTSQELTALKVWCPPGCDSSPIAHVAGLSLHPASSSMCSSAVVDGIIGQSGGEVMILLRSSQSRSYDPILRNVSSVSIHPYKSEGTNADSLFIPVLTDTIDDIASVIRVVDSFGKLSHTGRLELRREGTWGSVCIHGTTQTFNQGAAKVACQENGFLWGELIEEPCASALGFNYCGAKSLPVHSGAITCKGDENSFGDCTYQEATASSCLKHEADVVVHCTDHPPTEHPLQGTMRIVDTSGAPAASGLGRIEMFVGDDWGTVCNDDWRRESAGVLCRELGYDSLADMSALTSNKTLDDDVCKDILGSDYCGPTEEKISASNVACEGSEERLRDCPMVVSEDIYCVHSEDVVVRCKGPGDPSGVGLYIKDRLPTTENLPLRPMVTLKCLDPFTALLAKEDLLPGTIVPVACPAACRDQSGPIIGTDIYTTSSSVCHAGIHSGVNTDSGSPFAVLAAHGQSEYTGTLRNGILSTEGSQTADAFVPVPLLADVAAKMVANVTESAMGFYGTSKLPRNFKSYRDDWQSVQTALSFLAVQVKAESDSGDQPDKPIPPLVAFCNGEPGQVKFRGGAHDVVTLSYLPHGAELQSLRSFSLFFRIKPAVSGDQKWRSIVSYSECEGFAVSIDPHGEIVFEQMCSPHVLYSGIHPMEGQWSRVSISYDAEMRKMIFADDSKVTKHAEVNFDIRWLMLMKAGKSATLEYEPFIGEISHVFVYDQPLVKDDGGTSALNLVLANVDNVCAKQATPQPAAEYSNAQYHLCITNCVDVSSVATRLEDNYRPPSLGSLPVDLGCSSTLDNTPALSGPVGSVFEVSCPSSCPPGPTSVTVAAAASKADVFSSRVPICDAILQKGLRPADHQRIKVQILPGQRQYLPRANAGGDKADKFDLRSFAPIGLTETPKIDCNTTATFLTFKYPVGSRHLLRCPACDDENGNAIDHALQTDDAETPICQAARRRGLLTTAGGDVLLTIHAHKDAKKHRVPATPPVFNFLTEESEAPPVESRGFALLPHPGGVNCRLTRSMAKAVGGSSRGEFLVEPPNCESEGSFIAMSDFLCDSLQLEMTAVVPIDIEGLSLRLNENLFLNVELFDQGAFCSIRETAQQLSTLDDGDSEEKRSLTVTGLVTSEGLKTFAVTLDGYETFACEDETSEASEEALFSPGLRWCSSTPLTIKNLAIQSVSTPQLLLAR